MDGLCKGNQDDPLLLLNSYKFEMIICKTNRVVRLSFIVSVANHPSTELYYYHAIWPTHEEQQQNPQRRRHIFMLSIVLLPRLLPAAVPSSEEAGPTVHSYGSYIEQLCWWGR